MENIIIDGEVKDLSHLDKFIVTVPGKGKNGADLNVEVSIGLHVVSEGCDRKVSNMVDEKGNPRLFCQARYNFSLGLPELARRMITDKYSCWVSKDRHKVLNYALIDPDEVELGEKPQERYMTVFFYLYPSKKAGVDVIIRIVSCYSYKFSPSKKERHFDLHYVLRKCFYEQKRMP